MSSCPRFESGQPQCSIVEHPDDSSQSFCSTCKDRFRKEGHLFPSSFPAVVLLGVLFALLFGGGFTPRNREVQTDVLLPSVPSAIPAPVTSDPFAAPPIS